MRFLFTRTRSLAFALVLLCIGIEIGARDMGGAFIVGLIGMVAISIGEGLTQPESDEAGAGPRDPPPGA